MEVELAGGLPGLAHHPSKVDLRSRPRLVPVLVARTSGLRNPMKYLEVELKPD